MVKGQKKVAMGGGPSRRRQRLEGGSVFKELLLTANRTVQELP
jgi:hypothetical protein